MAEHNHRRGTKRKNRAGSTNPFGRVVAGNGNHRGWTKRNGLRDSAHAHAGEIGKLSGLAIGSNGIGNDFTNGRRGMAKAVRGAKKFVRTRIRFYENAVTSRLAEFAGSDG